METDAPHVSDMDLKIQIVDLYTVGHNSEKPTQPFIHQLSINTGIGGLVHVQANIDDSALTNAMSITKFNAIKHRLGYYKPSPRLLHMAEGSIVKPKAVWEGQMEIGGVQVFGSFKVFESGGSWEFLLGKPTLTALHSIHEYMGDTITIENKGLSAVLKNQVNNRADVHNEADKKGTRVWKKRVDLKGSVSSLPSREVQTNPLDNLEQMIDIAHIETTEPNPKNTHASEPRDNDTSMTIEIEVDTLKHNDNVYKAH